MTPFLILGLKMNPVLAVGTDLVFASITKFGGGFQHWRQRTIDLKPVFWLALGSLPASLMGSRYLLARIGDEYNTQVFLPFLLGLVLTVVGVIVFSRAAGWPTIHRDRETQWPPRWAYIAIGLLGGLLVGMTSIGGGTVIMALLVIFFVIPSEQLVGLDVLHGAILALFSTSTYALAGQIDWSLIGWLVLGSLPGVWLGERAVTIVPEKFVSGILGLVLLIAGVNLLFKG